jgi:minor histocompatibility antigen H13
MMCEFLVDAGIFVALALRFDLSRGHKKTYFYSAFAGYFAGLLVTILIMNWFQTAQPALLYIVPCVIGFLAVHCAWNGEIKQVCFLVLHLYCCIKGLYLSFFSSF